MFLVRWTGLLQGEDDHVLLSVGEGVCNAAGLGFSGYDEDGAAQWDLAVNIRPLEFEVCVCVRACVRACVRTVYVLMCSAHLCSAVAGVLKWVVLLLCSLQSIRECRVNPGTLQQANG